MDDKRRGNNIFELYSARRTADRAEEKQELDAWPYVPFAIGEEKQDWLLLYTADDIVRLVPYHELKFVIYNQLGKIGMQFLNFSVMIEGRNLTPLIKLIQMRQLSEVYCITHEQAMPEGDGTLITRLDFINPAEIEQEEAERRETEANLVGSDP